MKKIFLTIFLLKTSVLSSIVLFHSIQSNEYLNKFCLQCANMLERVKKFTCIKLLSQIVFPLKFIINSAKPYYVLLNVFVVFQLFFFQLFFNTFSMFKLFVTYAAC